MLNRYRSDADADVIYKLVKDADKKVKSKDADKNQRFISISSKFIRVVIFK